MALIAFPPWYLTSQLIAQDGSIAGSYADAVVVELLAGGAERVSMSAVAARINCTPSAVHHASGGRAEFLTMVVQSFGWRYVSWLQGPSAGRPFQLPLAADEFHAVRVWQTLTEIAAGEARAGRPELATLVAEMDAREGDVLAWRLNVAASDLARGRVSGTLAAVRGIRADMAREVDSLDLATAESIAEMLCVELTHM